MTASRYHQLSLIFVVPEKSHFTQRPSDVDGRLNFAGASSAVTVAKSGRTEVLTAWVLCSMRHYLFIRQIVSVLQIVQSDHQPNRDARPSFFRVKIAELLFGCVPVNLAGQFVQRVTLIQHLIQPQPEQVNLGNLLDFTWFHFARNSNATDRILANSTSLERPSKKINSTFLWVVQGRPDSCNCKLFVLVLA
jgi:hypothetical protein